MKKFFSVIGLTAVLCATTAVVALVPQRYLHVRVNDISNNEVVRINLPLALAEKILPAINHGKLQNGKIEFDGFHVNDVNLKEIFDALKTAPEGEFVTVEGNDSDVRVAKQHSQLVVHVVDNKKGKDKESVDVTIPWAVAQALTSESGDNQLNVEAAIKALESAGNVTLVTVNSSSETVRVWIDSNSE